MIKRPMKAHPIIKFCTIYGLFYVFSIDSKVLSLNAWSTSSSYKACYSPLQTSPFNFTKEYGLIELKPLKIK